MKCEVSIEKISKFDMIEMEGLVPFPFRIPTFRDGMQEKNVLQPVNKIELTTARGTNGRL